MVQPSQAQPYNPGMTMDNLPPVMATNPNTPLVFQQLAQALEKYEQARQTLWQIVQQRDQLLSERQQIVAELLDYQKRDVPWDRIDITDDGIDEIPEVTLPLPETKPVKVLKPAKNGPVESTVPEEAPA